jgi:hypothetical protein
MSTTKARTATSGPRTLNLEPEPGTLNLEPGTTVYLLSLATNSRFSGPT